MSHLLTQIQLAPNKQSMAMGKHFSHVHFTMHKYSLQYSIENRDTHVHQIRKADLCSCQTNTTTKLLRKDCTISSVWSLTQEHCKFSVSQNNELIGKAQCFLDPTQCYQERRPERWRERWRQGWGMEEVREQGGGRERGRIEREEEERGEGETPLWWENSNHL